MQTLDTLSLKPLFYRHFNEMSVPHMLNTLNNLPTQGGGEPSNSKMGRTKVLNREINSFEI